MQFSSTMLCAGPGSPVNMRLLFVKLRHIGDALLMTAMLTAIRARYPNAEIAVVVRRGTEGILAGCPAIDQLFTTAPAERSRRNLATFWQDLQLLGQIRKARFDYAFELTHADRGRLLVGLSKAHHRGGDACIYPPKLPFRWFLNRASMADWSHVHRAEADWEIVNAILPLGDHLPGPMVFDKARTLGCGIPGDDNTVIIHPVTRWVIKEWPLERWVAVAKGLVADGRRVVVSVGPDPNEIAIGEKIKTLAGAGVVSTAGQLNWAQLAGLMHQAALFVGVDTAAMHLAAACGLPSVALFHSRAQSLVWRPWKVPAEVLLPPGETGEGQMVDITDDTVEAACRRLLRPG
jgi:heptosyltransferase III